MSVRITTNGECILCDTSPSSVAQMIDDDYQAYLIMPVVGATIYLLAQTAGARLLAVERLRLDRLDGDAHVGELAEGFACAAQTSMARNRRVNIANTLGDVRCREIGFCAGLLSDDRRITRRCWLKRLP